MADNPYGLMACTPDHADALLDFVLPIYEEDAAQPVSVDKVRVMIDRCCARDRAMAAYVATPDGTIQASVGAMIDYFDYSDEPHLMIKWLGVAPAYRRVNLASRLVSYVGWLYQAMNVDGPIPVFIPTLTSVEQRSKVMLYQRRLPQVGVLHAFGCLPDRSFFNPARVGRQKEPVGISPKVPASVRPEPVVAQAG